MNTNDIATDKRDNRVLSLTAFTLFLVGFFLPFLCWAFQLSDAFIFLACGAELLALVFGLISWRLKLGKVATIGAGLICVIGVINYILFRFLR